MFKRAKVHFQVAFNPSLQAHLHTNNTISGNSIKCVFHDMSAQARLLPHAHHFRTTCLLDTCMAFKDTNNVDDLEMENNSILSQFQPYFSVLDRNDDYLDHAVM